MIEAEPGTRQQVLGLESENAPHLKAVDKALSAAIGMRHKIDELTGVDLLDQVALEEPVPPDDHAPVRQGERRLLVSLAAVGRIGESMNGRVEDVEDEPSIRLEMASDGGEAGELFPDRHEMLEWPEWDSHETERATKFEISHVSAQEIGPSLHIRRLVSQATAGRIKHPFGRVEPRDLNAGARGWDEDAPRPTTELEDGAP